MLALALAFALQDLDADYLKEVGRIRKDHAKALFELATSTSAKKERYAAARADLQRVLELDPDHPKAKDLLEKMRDLPDRGRGEDKPYLEKKKKLRADIVKKYEALAAKMTDKALTTEADDARKRAEEVKNESDDLPLTPEETILKRLNQIRASCGLPEVVLDPALSKGCKAHAEYLVKNDDQRRASGLSAHDEDPTLPGYTPEGAKAGKSSDIGYRPPEEATDDWNDTLYHRIPLLQPTLKRVGAAHALGGKSGNVCLLELVSGVEGKCDPKFATVAYPPDGAKGIGTAFGLENPNPVPEGIKAGYPITLTFFDGSKVTEVVASLREGPPPKTKKEKLGAEVECFVSTPEKPATSRTQSNTVCLIPKAPLAAATTYTVVVGAKTGTQKFEKTWSFTTR